MKKNKIVVVGLGYVGLSNSILLALNNTVTAVDINIDKVKLINKGLSPLEDKDIENYLKNEHMGVILYQLNNQTLYSIHYNLCQFL